MLATMPVITLDQLLEMHPCWPDDDVREAASVLGMDSISLSDMLALESVKPNDRVWVVATFLERYEPDAARLMAAELLCECRPGVDGNDYAEKLVDEIIEALETHDGSHEARKAIDDLGDSGLCLDLDRRAFPAGNDVVAAAVDAIGVAVDGGANNLYETACGVADALIAIHDCMSDTAWRMILLAAACGLRRAFSEEA